MRRNFWNSRAFFVILSIVFAVFLYFNANSTTSQNTGTANVGGQIYSTTLKNLPIAIRYNSSKYFISGYVSSANINLTSYNQIKLLQEESSDSRTLTLVADLTDLGVGTHNVPIKVLRLPSSLNAQVTPDAMTVTVETKATKHFQVTPVIADSLVPQGYSVASATVDPAGVTVTAGEESIKRIVRVEAVLPSNSDLHQDYSGSVNLIAVDKNDQVVPAMFSKSSVRIKVDVSHQQNSPNSD